MELESVQRAKRARVRDAVLLSLYGGAAVAMMVAMPNAVRLLKYIDPQSRRKRDPNSRIREAFRRLEGSGLIGKDARGRYALTEKGRHAAALSAFLAKPKPRRWDGKWRIVIFDVWERRRKVRDELRRRLQGAGFVRLQDSVWVTPYPCEDLIAYVRTELKLGPGLLYIIADGIEGEARLRRRFKLP
jgi:hypothetical protein